ncbi:phage major tail protein, TP901-1 family [Lederbergia citri]|uniref:Phage major tail protein, TP901-1 family n=1 Tax=Lederbergia citri TaxID=2833580 RepID=A0A942TFQ6_9BACI|nr:phage major tail protein, TP901-1 family [Lederbergia citri]MBS4195329.1 phage major tail protein, TP901-1 family [Lederbergia citri]
MTKILRGGDKVFAIRFMGELDEEQTLRVLYQTDGGRTISADETEINTKDIDGVDYGAVTEEISFEGFVGIDDPALDRIKTDLRGKKFVEILEIDINTLKADVGNYMINNLEFSYPDKESATYSFSAKLSGNLKEETLTDVPAGATEI